MKSQKFILLSGSPRGKQSTSYSILHYLKSQLKVKHTEYEILMLHKILRKESEIDKLLVNLDSTDYVILAAPLYVDSLPSHAIKFLQQIVDYRKKVTSSRRPKFIAIINSGFPEKNHNTLAIEICKKFSDDADFEWTGGLPYGGGAIIDGTPLESAGFRGRHARQAIEILAESILRGEPVPEACIERINKGVIPKHLYTSASHMRWKRAAKTYGVSDLDQQPYEEE